MNKFNFHCTTKRWKHISQHYRTEILWS